FISAQVGQKVVSVTVYDLDNKPVTLPYLGEKHILLFYMDPDHPSQNEEFRNELKKKSFTNENIKCYGVVNLKDAPLISSDLLISMVKKEAVETKKYVFTDPDNSLSRAWDLGDVNNKFVVIWINKDSIIEFYKAGQLTDEEVKEVYALIKKYKDEPRNAENDN
ncbi:MAG: YtfJ family protein, partial [Odoribacter sp.]|nr:YtfJ family protein [Odoribacter sp.]